MLGHPHPAKAARSIVVLATLGMLARFVLIYFACTTTHLITIDDHMVPGGEFFRQIE